MANKYFGKNRGKKVKDPPEVDGTYPVWSRSLWEYFFFIIVAGRVLCAVGIAGFMSYTG
jgi:hypothetical protein